METSNFYSKVGSPVKMSFTLRNEPKRIYQQAVLFKSGAQPLNSITSNEIS